MGHDGAVYRVMARLFIGADDLLERNILLGEKPEPTTQ
jgi:hypothetical protein